MVLENSIYKISVLGFRIEWGNVNVNKVCFAKKPENISMQKKKKKKKKKIEKQKNKALLEDVAVVKVK